MRGKNRLSKVADDEASPATLVHFQLGARVRGLLCRAAPALDSDSGLAFL